MYLTMKNKINVKTEKDMITSMLNSVLQLEIERGRALFLG